MLLGVIILGMSVFTVTIHGSGLPRDSADESAEMPFYKASEPKAVLDQPASLYSVGRNDFQAQERSFSKQADRLNEKEESDTVNAEEQKNYWAEVQSTENLMKKAPKLGKNTQALANHYPYEWTEGTKNAEQFGTYEKEMSTAKPRGPEILYDSKPPLEDISTKAETYQALEEHEGNRPSELNKDEAVNRPNFPLFAKSGSRMVQANLVVKEEGKPELERDAVQWLVPKVRVNSWQAHLPVPLRNRQLIRSNTVVKQWQPPHGQHRIALDSESPKASGDIPQMRSSKNMADAAANSPPFSTSEGERKEMETYNDERRPGKTVSIFQEQIAPDSFVKKTVPFSQAEETSGSLEIWPGARNVWNRQFLQQKLLSARNGISGSLPAQQEQQSARDITSGNMKDIRKHKLLIKQAAPSQPSLLLPKMTDYQKGPVRHLLEGMPEEEAGLAVVLRPAQSKIAGLSKGDESTSLRESPRNDNPSLHGHSSQPADENYRLPKLLHQERYEDLSATGTIQGKQVAYPEEAAVAFQPGLYGPKSAALVNGGFEPKHSLIFVERLSTPCIKRDYMNRPLDVMEPHAHAENLGSAGTMHEAKLVHAPELSVSTLMSQRHKLRPAEYLDTSDSQRSRPQEALVTPTFKLASEPDEKAPLKTSFTHVSESDTKEVPLSLQNDLGFTPSQIKNGFEEQRKDRAQYDYLAVQPKGATKSAARVASAITHQEGPEMSKQESAAALNMPQAYSSTEDTSALFLPNLAPAPVRMAISKIIHGLGTKASQHETSAKSQEEQSPYEMTGDQLFVRNGEPLATAGVPLSRQEQVPSTTGKETSDQAAFQPVEVADESSLKDHSAGQETGGFFKELESPPVRPLGASLFHKPSYVTKSESAIAAFRSQYPVGHDLKERPVHAAGNLRLISPPAQQITALRKPKMWNFELATGRPSFEAQYGSISGITSKKFSQGEDDKKRIPTRQETFPKPLNYPSDIYRQEHKHITAPQNLLRPLQWRGPVVPSGAPLYASGNGKSGSIDQEQELRKGVGADLANRKLVESGKVRANFFYVNFFFQLHFMATAKPSKDLLKVGKAKTMPLAPLHLDHVSIADTLLQRGYTNESYMKFDSTKMPDEEVTVRRSQELFLPLEQTIPSSSPRELHAEVLANVAPAYAPVGTGASKQRRIGRVKPDKKPIQSEPFSQLHKMLPVQYEAAEGQNDDAASQSDYKGTTEKMSTAPSRSPLRDTEVPTLNQHRLTSLENQTRVHQPEYSDQESVQHTTTYTSVVSDRNVVQTSTVRQEANGLELDGEMNHALQNASLQSTSKKSPKQEKDTLYEPRKTAHQEQIPKGDQSSLGYKLEPSALAASPQQSRIGYGLGKPSAFKVEVKGKEGLSPVSHPGQGIHASTSKTEKTVNEKANERIASKQKSHQWQPLIPPPFVPLLPNDEKVNSVIPPGGSSGAKLYETQESGSLAKPQSEQVAKESIQREGIAPVVGADAGVTAVPTYPMQPVTFGSGYASPRISLWGLHERKWIDFRNGLREAAVQSFGFTNQPWRTVADERKDEKKVNDPSTSGLISPFNFAGKLLQAKLASFLEDKPLVADEIADRTPESKPAPTTSTKA
ncbi:hypothetical protein M514_00952 [Trichuris suis]|uniref:Zasp-like motif domain-containing protein n=1 Tax=Trichuris suis TaxID=68888 RepID=A0A085MLU3_9BILA|nr:hypothetical protein M513_00952 [Trichuris suis]KFD70451.1 hypothetical protein M514_00952 [Trichuris suis]